MNNLVIWSCALTLLTSSASAQLPGSWTYDVKIDPISDRRVSKTSATSSDGSARLLFKCDSAVEQVVSVQYITPKYLGSSSRPVTIRFDQSPPLTFVWEVAFKGAFFRDKKGVGELAKLAGKSRSIFVRAYDYNDQPVDARFNVSDKERVIGNVFSDCAYETPGQ